MFFRSALAVLLCLVPLIAKSQTLDEVKKYDFNHDGYIQAGPELDGFIKEFVIGKNGNINDPKILSRIGDLKSWAKQRPNLGIPVEALAVKKPISADPCGVQHSLYIRNDRVDALVSTDSLSSAKGASISFTRDRLTNLDSATINAAVGYLVRNPCVQRPDRVGTVDAYLSGFAVAPSLVAKGTLGGNPAKEKSALRFGVDTQFEIFSGAIFNDQYFTASPYYQTDFRGIAQAYGLNAMWEPYLLPLRLGGRAGMLSSWIDFYWTFQAEADLLRVDRAGLTDLTSGTDYAWLGGTVTAYVYLLPEQLNRRLVASAAYNYFWDARSDRSIWLFTASLQYNLNDSGTTSVALQYQKGTDKITLQESDQYLATLNFKL